MLPESGTKSGFQLKNFRLLFEFLTPQTHVVYSVSVKIEEVETQEKMIELEHFYQELFHAGCLFSEQKKVPPLPLPKQDRILPLAFEGKDTWKGI